MNKARMKRVNEIDALLFSALDILNEIVAEERDAFDNMPEGLQNSAKGERISETADTLESVRDEIDNAISELRFIIEELLRMFARLIQLSMGCLKEKEKHMKMRDPLQTTFDIDRAQWVVMYWQHNGERRIFGPFVEQRNAEAFAKTLPVASNRSWECFPLHRWTTVVTAGDPGQR